MLSCPNPRCNGRKKGGFTLIGLHRHFRQLPLCEEFYDPLSPNDPGGNRMLVEESATNGSTAMSDDFIPPTCDSDANDFSQQQSSNEESDGDNCSIQQKSSYEESDDDNPNVSWLNEHPPDSNLINGSTTPHYPDSHVSPGTLHTLPPKVYDPTQQNAVTPLEWIKKWRDVTATRNQANMFHPSGMPDDVTLLDLLISDPNYHQGWHVISDVEKAEIRLMHRLNKIKGCPLFVYDAVREWAKENLYSQNADETNSDEILNMLKSRLQLISDCPKFAHTSVMKPKTSSVPLPGCGKSIDITTMSYHGNLYNQLTSNNLVNDDTLLINGDTPYADPVLPRGNYQFDDFNTGTRYVQSWKVMKLSDIDFPLGDVLFIDKSNYDFGDRLTAEPVMHTNSLIRCSARYQSSAWYNLGTLPSFKTLTHNETCDKILDYHKCLEHIFVDYINIQKNTAGILWPLFYRGKYYMVRFRPYMLTCLGDTPGQNVVAGKSSGNRKCRYCDVEKENLSDPWVTSNLITSKKHNEFIKSDDLCKEYGYVKCPIVWSKINFGEDKFGIHGNLPGEILHAYQKGLMVRVLDGLVAAPKMSQAAKKIDKRLFLENVREKEGNSDEGESPSNNNDTEQSKAKEITQEDLIKRGVFGGGMGKMVGAISVELGQQLAHQSDRNICRTYFPQGIMVRTKMTASEQQGLTFLFAMILSSTWSLQSGGIRDNLGDERIGGYVNVLENLLCLEELLKMHPGKSVRTLMKRDIPSITSYTQLIMSTAKELVNRTTGDGFNLIKFHLLTHMIQHDIYKYGLPRNISGSPGENQFKDNFKLAGSTTQKRDYSFDKQVSERHYEHVTIAHCVQRLDRSDNHYLRQASSIPLKEHFGSVMRNNPEHAGSNTQSASNPLGISEPMYTVMKVTPSSTSLDSILQPTLDIVYNGRLTSGRAAKFPRINSGHLIGMDGKPAGTKGLAGLSSVNDSFQDIIIYLKPLFEVSSTFVLDIYTVLKVKKKEFQDNDVMYRADPYCSLTHKERHDWALFEWEDENIPRRKTKVPGQILGFLDVDPEFIRLYNSSLSVSKPTKPPLTEVGQYAFIISLEEEIPALMDPTITSINEDVIMQSNSHLFFWGEQETELSHSSVRRRGKTVKTTKRTPVVRLVEVSSIVRPLIVVRDFSPTFSGTKKGVNIDLWVETKERQFAWIIVRPRDLWHLVFMELAKKHHLEETVAEDDGSL